MRDAICTNNNRTRRILSILFLILGLFSFRMTAEATEIGTIQCEETHEGLGGLEEIKEPAKKSRFTEETLLNGSGFGDSYRDQLDDLSGQVYDSLYRSYQEGAHGNKVDLGLPELIFRNQQITVNVTNSFSISDSLRNEISEQINSSVSPAFYALLYDHPELNWLINVSYSTSWSMSISDYRITTNKRPLEVSGVTVTISNIDFRLTAIYQDTGDKEDMDRALDVAVAAMKGYPYYIGNMATDEGRIKIIHDYLCNTVAYTGGSTSDRIYQTPYSALVGRETVCAGYAKAFKLLCARYDIPCVLISGWGKTSNNGEGESHMWNYVKLDDSWYGVDCTWDDQTDSTTDRIYYDFYLAGSETIDTYFGKRSFGDSHVETPFWSGSGMEFQYPQIAIDKYEAHEHIYVNGSCTICGKAVQVRITDQPSEPEAVTFGYTKTAELTVGADNDASDAMTYQWYRAPVEEKDGKEVTGSYEALPNATKASYTIPTGYDSGKWSFYCRVSCYASFKDTDPVTFVVKKAVPQVKTGQSEYTVSFGAKDFQLGCEVTDTAGQTVGLEYEVTDSENAFGETVVDDEVVTINTEGVISVTGAGKAVIRVWCEETDNTAQSGVSEIKISVAQAEVEELGEYGYPLKIREGKVLSYGQTLENLQFDATDAMFWFYNGSEWLYGFYENGTMIFGTVKDKTMQIIATVEGEFRWKDPGAVPDLGESEAEWIFVETESANLKELSGRLTVTVKEPQETDGGNTEEVENPDGGNTEEAGESDGSDPETVEKPADPVDDGRAETPSGQDGQTSQAGQQTADSTKWLPVGYLYEDTAKKAVYCVTDEGEVSFFCKDKNIKTVTIPNEVVILGEEYDVTSVAANAFKNCKKLKKVTLGENITDIGANAFAKCIALKKLTIPEDVENIGKNAFSGCKKLKTITIRTKELTAGSIGSKAFKGIAANAVVKVPKAVKADYTRILKKKGLPKTAVIK